MTDLGRDGRLSDEQLAEWEALAEAATEGPWDQNAANGVHRGHACVALTYGETGWQQRKADAQFIAAARSAVPSLLRALRDARDEHRRAMDFGDRRERQLVGMLNEQRTAVETWKSMLEPVGQEHDDHDVSTFGDHARRVRVFQCVNCRRTREEPIPDCSGEQE